ncbi:MAG: hypothetical protein H7256_11400 [Bdellovibrio sp.]|nr:hypothetical protein [Bdellovibrio sp.]
MSIYSRSVAYMVILLSFTIAFISGCSSPAPRPIDTSAAPFVETPPAKPYVSLDLAYPYYKMISDKLDQRLKTTLKNRGEAHITLITPPEFKVLTTKIEPRRIHTLANEFMATEPKIKNLCLGHFQKKIEGQPEHTYYVVIESSGLVEFRKKIAEESGLSKTDFDPELFFPHVTIGFTARDLHFEDGAIKNQKSCPANLKSILRER